ncbi:cral trio domain containing protein [Pyrenophora teres f. maculata]|nr:cral trio domain containing protein [Pyrenophora teres f. maculata]
MAAKPEEVNTALVEATNAPVGASAETQPEPQLRAETTEKKDESAAVETTTAAVADLSVVEKEEGKTVEEATPVVASDVPVGEKKEEDKPAEEAAPAAVSNAPVAETTEGAAPAAPADVPVADQKVEEEKTVEQGAPAAATTTTTTTTTAETTPSDANANVEASENPLANPEASTETPTSGPMWPKTAPDHPLTRFYDDFEELVASASHNEVYGIELSKNNEFHTKLILQKFLRANQNDIEKAKAQLLKTLKWRKEFDPIKAASETYDKAKFDGLGYVLEVEGVPESPNAKDVATFNIYGAVKDNKATFGDLALFLRWRVGLMEKSIQALHLSSATTPIPDYGQGPDPYQGFQIHDYLQVSFLRRDPLVKTATNKTIEILGAHYPETLSRKFFVNVPAVMGWVFQAVKLVVAKETSRKFVVLSNGSALAGELGKGVPKSYGGEREELAVCAEGMSMV